MNTYPRGTVEYVAATITESSGRDLSSDPVEVSIHRGYPDTWLPALWSSPGVVRTVDPVSFTADAYPQSVYMVSVRVTDNPERPVLDLGSISIV